MPAFDNLLIVVSVAFAAPLVLGFFSGVKLPSVVLEILAGIVIGPSVLGIVEVDESVQVVALLGFALSFVIALLVALLLKGTGLIETPLLVAIMLCATSLGVLIPVLKD